MDPALIGEILAILMFLGTIGAVLLGYPVAFTLAGTGLIFALLGQWLDVFDPALLTGLANRYFGTMMNEVLVAVPLFVFMGVMLERSRLAEDLLTTMGELFGNLRGGLGISVVLVGTLLAASTGIVGATVVTMGLLSLPAMVRAGYDPRLAAGVICASGTLGQIIPPSTVLIFMGDMLQGANQQAQLAMGNFAPAPISVGQLFAGALIPGVVLSLMYMGWVVLKAVLDPQSCPALPLDPAARAALPRKVLVSLVPPLLLIVAVLGSILTGIASPTESASVGAVGAMLLAATRRQLTLPILREVMRSTLTISSMVFVILLGASVFSLVFRGLGGEELVHDALTAMPAGKWGALIAVMLLMFVLGFFLDTFEIIFIVVPITAPVLIRLGVDPLWLGVMMGINLQTSFLTPPFGFALFYLRGVAGKLVSTVQIYRGAVPFIGIQLLAVGLVLAVPQTTLWLPNRLFEAPVRTATVPVAVQAPRESAAPSGGAGFEEETSFDNLFGEPEPGTRPPPDWGDRFDNLFED
ncbi:TRAP transporter large permease [Indioceanicola profundi]|uniref:TRAP transporter large permease n=1 Tax=Indioceanicola profundi TaxID=2220096 RepID=UPI000E6ADC6B|nr:TRAP transporter large permease subunit [Indioceanicola profundi]